MPDLKMILSLANLTPAKFIRAAFVVIIPVLYLSEKTAINNARSADAETIKDLKIALAICAKSKDELYAQKEAEKNAEIEELKRGKRASDSLYIENLKQINRKIERNNKVLKTIEK